jgi:hypothetical protein
MKLNKILKPIFFCCFLFINVSIWAQTSKSDELHLRNGSIIKGTITENTTEKISIKTSDGREYIFNKTEIEQVVQNGQLSNQNMSVSKNNELPYNADSRSGRKYYTPPAKGFWFSGEIQLLSPASINIVAGYKLHRFAYLGLGTGIHNYTEINFSKDVRPFTGTIVPIYVRYSGDILNRRVTPVYSIEAGYGIAASNGPMFSKNTYYSYTYGYSTSNTVIKGGFYGSIGFGFKVRTNKNISFGAGFMYRIQQASIKESGVMNNGQLIASDYKYLNSRFGLKLIFVGFN